jgi:hypothetical protein
MKVQRISKRYGRQLAVDDVSFSIAPREIAYPMLSAFEPRLRPADPPIV